MKEEVFALKNQLDGSLAFKIVELEDVSYCNTLHRTNNYSIVWIHKGSGSLKVDFSKYSYTENSIFTFAPHQPFMFVTNGTMAGIAIQFHSDFFCIHANHTEVGCDGVLFNNIYEKPFFSIRSSSSKLLHLLVEQMKNEVKQVSLAQYEQIVSYLKIFLITSSRIKQEENVSEVTLTNDDREPQVLKKLKTAIETHFREKHLPSHYAEMLSMSGDALTKLTKNYYNKTLSDLITERIILEAKRELYMSDKSVKEIAWYLGYNDAYHFGRVFKKCTQIAPQKYRKTVRFATLS